jgi:serine/threonine protein kinase
MRCCCVHPPLLELAARLLQLHRRLLSDPEAMARFRAEIVLMSRLRHACLGTFYGATWEPPRVCLLMELFSRGSAHDVLASPAALSFADPLGKWACEVARCMAYLHRKRVVHRDLKCQNVMVTDVFGVKVVDLGEARALRADETMTSVGTPHWCAPEVLRGERYDEMCDVYSFGIFLFELAAREAPYKGLPQSIVLPGVVAGTLRPEMPPDAPTPLVDLARACWAHLPMARPSFAACADRASRFLLQLAEAEGSCRSDVAGREYRPTLVLQGAEGRRTQ